MTEANSSGPETMELEHVSVCIETQASEYTAETDPPPLCVKTEPDQDSSNNPDNSQVPCPILSTEQVQFDPDLEGFSGVPPEIIIDQNPYHFHESYFITEQQPAEVLYQIRDEMEESDSDVSGCGWFRTKGKKRTKKQKRRSVKKGKPHIVSSEGDLAGSQLFVGCAGVQTGFQSYICSECGKSFTGKSNILEHLQSHAQGRPHTCLQCNQTFMDAASLLRHSQQDHAGSEEYHCSLCGMRFQTVKAFAGHMRIHSADQLFICFICGKNFRHQSSLSRHQQIHKLEKPDSFLQSGGSSSTSGSRSSTSHSSSSSSSSTDGSSSESNEPVSKHSANTETPNKTFLCMQCGKRFNHSSSLSRHKHVHQQEKRQLKVTYSPDRRTSERRSKQPGKPYSCQYCNKDFSHPSSLSRHQQIHNQKPHPCSVCRKSFVSRLHLTNHMKCHGDRKVFPCPECDKTFNHSSSLSRHRLCHTS